MSDQYIFEIQKAKQLFLFLGVRHSRNPEDEQWRTLETAWSNFLVKAGDKRSIFFEGPEFDVPRGLPIDEQIKKYGEAGQLLSLNRAQDAELHWPEISMREESQELARKFDKDLVDYFIFARTAGSWLRGGAHGNFHEAISRAANATARSVDSSAEVSYYSAIHEKIFGVPITEKESPVLIRAAAPVYKDSVVNEIGRFSNEIRDSRLVSEIHKYWTEGYSIFVLFGSHHAKSLESRLRRDLLGE